MTAPRPDVDARRVVVEQDRDDPATWWYMDEKGVVVCGTLAEVEARIRRQDKARNRRRPDAITATVIDKRFAR